MSEWIISAEDIDDITGGGFTVCQKLVRCYECKHNPKKKLVGCPMAHLNERQRPEDAWCWKGER